MHNPQSATRPAVLTELESKLAQWRRTASWPCKANYYHVVALEEWMDTIPDGNSQCNAARLLDELKPHINIHRLDTFDHDRVLDKQRRSVIVLAALVHLGHGDLIDVFRDEGIVDSRLLSLTEDNYVNLIDGLQNASSRHSFGESPASIIKRFKEAVWSFCPARITYCMEEEFENANVILPFCRVQQVNIKGGTASVYKVTVQEEFVDCQLRDELATSVVTDRDFGKCYRLALKIFQKGNRDVFKTEQEALRSLGRLYSSHALIKYLGFYHHGFGSNTPGIPPKPTYNILMEYGQLDLDEYFASTAPPVSFDGILSFYKNLFRIVEALGLVHDPVHEEQRQFVGQVSFSAHSRAARLNNARWHGDVKPDNILVVNGQCKLADFGFAKFKRATGEVPKSKMEGGTQAYGAPEQDRAFSNGMLDELHQTIDVWSFGTVLLTAATWIVSGFKGIQHFEVVRKDSIIRHRAGMGPTCKLPTCDDAFHDGRAPLPELAKWCDQIRDSVRKCDVVTSDVLQLAQEKMLLAEPRDRVTCNDLQTALKNLLEDAADNHDKMIRRGELSKSKLSASALQAIYAHEIISNKRGSEGKAPKTTVTVDALVNNETVPLSLPLESSAHKSNRKGKSEKIGKSPMPRTSNLEEELKGKLETLGSKLPKIDETLIEDGPESSGRIRSSASALGFRSASQSPRGLRRTTSKATPSNGNSSADNTRLLQPREATQSGPSAAMQRLDQAEHNSVATQLHPRTAPGDYYDGNIEQPSNEYARNGNFGADQELLPSGLRRSLGKTSRPSGPPSMDYGDRVGLQSHSGVEVVHADQPATSITPDISSPERTQSIQPFSEVTSPSASGSTGSAWVPAQVRPSPTLYPESTTLQSPDQAAVSSGLGLQVALHPQHRDLVDQTSKSRYEPFPRPNAQVTTSTLPAANRTYLSTEESSATSALRLPQRLSELEYQIVRTRVDLDTAEQSKGALQRTLSRLGTPKVDIHFQRFCEERDIVFIVDNATSMSSYKHLTAFVAETLAMKLRGIDEDGLDLRFTFGSKMLCNAKKDAPNKFRQAILDAWPASDYYHYTTDMSATLSKIYNEYFKKSQKKATTLLIFTDGRWSDEPGTEQSDPPKDEGVERILRDFTKDLKQHRLREKRFFTVQFIQIGERLGEEERATKKLKRLDNELEQIYQEEDFRDIVDHVPWTGSVNKMVLGSITDREDSREGPAAQPPPNIETLCGEWYDVHDNRRKPATSLSIRRGR